MLITVLADVPTTTAVPIVNDHFNRTWQRTDKPVTDLVVSRTWMWGNEPFTAAGPEKYVDAPGGLREVQYFDKSRMEINHNAGVPTDSPWYVTNGLLVKELMTGQMQVGDATFEPREPARVNVAGDPDDTSGVTYWYMGLLQGEAPLAEGTVITQILSPGAAGNLYMWNAEFAAYGVTAARYVADTNHTVASPFWNFMNSRGTVYENGGYREAALFQDPFYATGFPLTEAYWANVKVAGTVQPVLIQCFQRRCLTYTPNNDPAWRVEAGNVGQHYFRWRYPTGSPTPPPTPVPGPVSYWYLNPHEAMGSALSDCGMSTTGWLAEDMFDISWGMPGIYSMTTVPVGSFNADTAWFYEWLKQWLCGTSNTIDLNHVKQQMYAAIYQPETEIARTLRELELGLHPVLGGSGPVEYYEYVAEPFYTASYGQWAPEFRLVFLDQFEGHLNAYLSDPEPYSGFAEYLRSIGYGQGWLFP